MIDLHDIRYLRIGTRDLESAIEYATRIVGLQLVAREGKSAYFRSDKSGVRGDTRDHTLVYFEGDPADNTAESHNVFESHSGCPSAERFHAIMPP